MNKTIHINLGNVSFSIDEDAYDKLYRYLESIKISLKINKEEVIKEVEARIAEILLEKRLSDLHIISMNDVNNVIEIMGKPSDYSALD